MQVSAFSGMIPVTPNHICPLDVVIKHSGNPLQQLALEALLAFINPIPGHGNKDLPPNIAYRTAVESIIMENPGWPCQWAVAARQVLSGCKRGTAGAGSSQMHASLRRPTSTRAVGVHLAAIAGRKQCSEGIVQIPSLTGQDNSFDYFKLFATHGVNFAQSIDVGSTQDQLDLGHMQQTL